MTSGVCVFVVSKFSCLLILLELLLSEPEVAMANWNGLPDQNLVIIIIYPPSRPSGCGSS